MTSQFSPRLTTSCILYFSIIKTSKSFVLLVFYVKLDFCFLAQTTMSGNKTTVWKRVTNDFFFNFTHEFLCSPITKTHSVASDVIAQNLSPTKATAAKLMLSKVSFQLKTTHGFQLDWRNHWKVFLFYHFQINKYCSCFHFVNVMKNFCVPVL